MASCWSNICLNKIRFHKLYILFQSLMEISRDRKVIDRKRCSCNCLPGFAIKIVSFIGGLWWYSKQDIFPLANRMRQVSYQGLGTQTLPFEGPLQCLNILSKLIRVIVLIITICLTPSEFVYIWVKSEVKRHRFQMCSYMVQFNVHSEQRQISKKRNSLSLSLLLSVNEPHVWNDPNNDLRKTSISREYQMDF